MSLCDFPNKKLHRVNGFTLLELMVAITIAAVLTAVSFRVYGLFFHGIVGTSNNYILFVTENAKELRCRTRFVRGFSPCDSIQSDGRHMKIRLRF